MTIVAPSHNLRRPFCLGAFCLSVFCLSALLLTLPIAASAAEPQPSDQPVVVRADEATFKQKAGTGVYRGHAEMIQGNRHLYADIIHLFTENGRLVRVVATGDPVHMVEGEAFDATAQKLVYNLKTHELVLTGEAHIKHQGSTFEGARVTYNLNTKRVDASGDSDERVRLVIPARTEKELTGKSTTTSGDTPASPGNDKPTTETRDHGTSQRP